MVTSNIHPIYTPLITNGFTVFRVKKPISQALYMYVLFDNIYYFLNYHNYNLTWYYLCS